MQNSVFLPLAFFNEKTHKSLAAKILTACARSEDITSAGRHAVDQLLLRLKFLQFDGTAVDLAVRGGSSTTPSDFGFEQNLQNLVESVHVDPQKPGATPDPDIFDRPLVRRRASQKGGGRSRTSWDTKVAQPFPSAIIAAQEFSFASSKVRHIDSIDDILIANNIVHSANGDKTESYNCVWSWHDAESDTQKHIEQQRSSESFLFPSKASGTSFGILDALCGPISAD